MKEHKRLEYKQEVSDGFLKTVSAFANYDGGDIVFGVSDTGQKVGIKKNRQRMPCYREQD